MIIRPHIQGHLWLLLGSLLLTACATHINAPDEPHPLPETNWEVERGVIYTPKDWPEVLRADIYRPVSEGPHPGVLVVHGGSWAGRSREDMDGFAERLAGHGFLVMNIDYRLAPEHRFPAQLHDLQQAMHWLHAEAEELNLDINRVGGFGYSAGAHLVSLLGLVASQPGSELDQAHGGPQTRLSAVVAGGLPSDLRKFGSGRILRDFLGGGLEEMPDRYEAASPVSHITPQAPPFFLFHGSWDALVPVHHSTDFQAALAARGVYAEMVLLEYRGHGLSFFINDAAMDAAVSFLGRFLLDGPVTALRNLP
jgi:acetyl esterase/lipase